MMSAPKVTSLAHLRYKTDAQQPENGKRNERQSDRILYSGFLTELQTMIHSLVVFDYFSEVFRGHQR